MSEFERVDARGRGRFWWNKRRLRVELLADGRVWETKCHPPDIFTGVTGTWMTSGVLHLHFRHFIRSSQHGSHTRPAALITCRVWEKNTAHGYIRVAETPVAFLRMQKVFFCVIDTIITKIKASVGCCERRLKLIYFTKLAANCSNLGLCNEKWGYNHISIISAAAKCCCLLLNFSVVDYVTRLLCFVCSLRFAQLLLLSLLPS